MEVVGYFVRIDAREGYGEKIRMLVHCDDYTSIAGMKHNGLSGENPHYHLVIKTQVQQQALRVRLRKIFDQGKGNGHMSIKVWDGDIKAVSYLFHEEDDGELFVRKNIEDEYLARARIMNLTIKTQVESSKGKASWTLEEDVYQEYVKKGDRYPDEKDVAVLVLLTAWRNGKYAPNDYLLKAIVGRVMFRLCDGDESSEEALAARIVGKIYRY